MVYNWQGLARIGKYWQGSVCEEFCIWQGLTRIGKDWQGSVWNVVYNWQGLERIGKDWQGSVWNVVWQGWPQAILESSLPPLLPNSPLLTAAYFVSWISIFHFTMLVKSNNSPCMYSDFQEWEVWEGSHMVENALETTNSFKAASLQLCEDCFMRELLFVCFGDFLCFCISLFYDNMWDQQIWLLAEL